MDVQWSLGVLIGLPIYAVLLGVTIWFLLKGVRGVWRDGWKDRYGMTYGALMTLAAGIALAVMAPIIAALYWPYKAEYHQWKPVEGKVTQIGSRLIGGGSTSQRYVLAIDGQPYGVDDTRASLVKVGDAVKLSCIREWQYASNPGWACRWAS